jgi:WD40 repeat protein
VTNRIRTDGTPYDSVSLSFSADAVSPDGKRLACRCQVTEKGRIGRPFVRIFDLATTRKQEVPADGLVWQGWSADGELLIVSLVKGAVLFRKPTAGQERRFEARDLPDARVGRLWCAHAARGNLLTFFDQQGVIHVCDTSTGRVRRTLDTKSTFPVGLAISADGRTLAAAVIADAEKRVVQVWDVVSGRISHTLTADQNSLTGVAFSPDGKTLATVAWRDVRFYDPVTGRERGRARGMPFFGGSVAFSPDGKTLATVPESTGTIQLWDNPSGAIRPAPEGHISPRSIGDPSAIAFAPDQTRVATAAFLDGWVYVWKVKTGEPVTRVQSPEWARSCAFSADGRSVFTYWIGENLDVADAGTGRVLHTLKVNDPGRPGMAHSGLLMQLSDDRKTLVAISRSSPRDGGREQEGLLITGWEAGTRKQLFRRRRAPIPCWPVVSPDARVLAFSHGDDRNVELSPEAGPVHLEDLRTGERVLDLPEVKGQTWPVAFSADGRLLATFTLVYLPNVKEADGPRRIDRTVRVWELASGQEMLALAGSDNAQVAFAADGRRLAVAGPDQDVLLWDLRWGREVRRVRGFDCQVTCLGFSPDGARLVSGLEDSTLLVWDATLPDAAEAGPPDASTLNRAWADLAGDPKKGFAARWTLARCPGEAVPFLRGRLSPVRPADSALLARLIRDLDSETFAAREKARARLEELGEQATGALVAVLGRKPSLEARRRLEELLARLRGPIRDRETLRAVRAVAVLEDIGTSEAIAVLKTLAAGLGTARQTQEARQALERASRRRP